MMSELPPITEDTVQALLWKLDETHAENKKLEKHVRKLTEQLHACEDIFIERDLFKKYLDDAEEALANESSENKLLRNELKESQSSIQTYETLLVESGSALQQLRDKCHDVTRENDDLKAKVEGLSSQNHDLTERNKELSINLKQQKLHNEELVASKKSKSIISNEKGDQAKVRSLNEYKKKYQHVHINIRDTLRNTADMLCDQLIQIEHHLNSTEPFEKKNVPDPYLSNAGRKVRYSKNSALAIQKNTTDYEFGKPSDRILLDSLEEQPQQQEQPDYEYSSEDYYRDRDIYHPNQRSNSR